MYRAAAAVIGQWLSGLAKRWGGVAASSFIENSTHLCAIVRTKLLKKPSSC